MDIVNEILNGAVDMHIHSGPGLMKRSVSHVEASKQAYDAGLRAIVIKDHHCGSYNLSPVIKEMMDINRPFDVFGSLTLNPPSCGLNPAVVELAIEYGAKVIWMPTLSSVYHRSYHKSLNAVNASTLPKVSSKLKYDESVTLLDDNGKLKQEVVDIIKLIADADIVLANGHTSYEETDAIIDKAKAFGIKKIVIDHPELQLRMSIDKMVEYAKAGVYLEHILAIIYSNKSSHEYIYEMIKATGVEYSVVSSDLGQFGRPVPMDGIRMFVEAMLELGMSKDDIETVIKKNPAKLLGIKD